jgi:hypothetical protein
MDIQYKARQLYDVAPMSIHSFSKDPTTLMSLVNHYLGAINIELGECQSLDKSRLTKPRVYELIC